MHLEYKVLALDQKAALDALSSEPGQLIGYASVFGGIDAYNDTIEPGAYAETIPQFIERGTLHAEHDPRIRLGTIANAVEDVHGLLISADFHSTPAAQQHRTQILERLQRGKFVGLSIGYLAEDFEMRPNGVRALKKIKLYEVSEVSVPADESAAVIAAKSAKPFDTHSDDVRVAVAEWVDRVRSGSDLRTKEGRAISTARRTRMASVSGSLREAADEIDAMLEETAPPKAAGPPFPAGGISLDREHLRRSLERFGVLERPA